MWEDKHLRHQAPEELRTLRGLAGASTEEDVPGELHCQEGQHSVGPIRYKEAVTVDRVLAFGAIGSLAVVLGAAYYLARSLAEWSW